MPEEIDQEHLETIECAKEALAKEGITDLLLVVKYEDGESRALFAGDDKALHQSVDFEVNYNDFVAKGYINPDALDFSKLGSSQNRSTAKVQLGDAKND